MSRPGPVADIRDRRGREWLRGFAILIPIGFLATGCVFPISISGQRPTTGPRPMASDPMTAAQERMLAEHNKFRAEARVPPLFWSSALTARAEDWAIYLARSAHRLEHSHTPGLGENLAMWTSGKKTPAELIDYWAREMDDFLQGEFPEVSRTGDWHSVGHYTQMIWHDTARVGCAIASGGGNDFLVCEYSPTGNVIGQKVY